MVLPDSRRIARVLRYSGVLRESPNLSPTGLSPSMVGHIQDHSARLSFCNSLEVVPDLLKNPTTPTQQRQHAYTESV